MVKRVCWVLLIGFVAVGLSLAIYLRICSHIGMTRSLRKAEIVKEMFESGKSLVDVEARLGKPDEVDTDSEGLW